jgi:hypothetical protein
MFVQMQSCCCTAPQRINVVANELEAVRERNGRALVIGSSKDHATVSSDGREPTRTNAMIYLTHARLMLESERTVHDRAHSGEEIPKRVCSQLLSDNSRYSFWLTRHDTQMNAVANARRRERQIMTLRSVSIHQIHRTALVRYLRDHRVTGVSRDLTLREFYGVMDPRESAIMEHRNYLLAASTQFCAADILELIGDTHGLDLVRRYELAYNQYFGMFCEKARARQTHQPYMLEMLMPEVRDAAERLRARIMDTRRLPTLASASAKATPSRRARSESFDPGPQIELRRPGAPRLSM